MPDWRNRTFKENLQISIDVAGKSEETTYGSDWFHLTPEEETVFAIDRKRFPRMVKTWEHYERFKGIIGGPAAEIEEARAAYPQWCGPGKDKILDPWEFAEFAKEFASLTTREAVAFFQKYEFWCVRNGITRYRDDPKD